MGFKAPVKFRYLSAMKKTLAICILLLSSTFLKAQVVGGQHDKLFDMFLLEKYEDTYVKAFKMTEQEKYLKDPEPFLYVSMACLKIANDPNLVEEYPDVFKDMIKYADKATKIIRKLEAKDIETISIEDQEDFFNELKDYTLNEIYFIWVENKYSKAASLYRKLMKIWPEDENILFLAGAGEVMSNNRQGEMKLDDCKKRFEEKYSDSSYEGYEESNNWFSKGLVNFTDWCVTNGKSDMAKEWIAIGYKYMPDDERIEAQYETIIN